MRRGFLIALVLAAVSAVSADDPGVEARRKEVNAVLDDWHKAAAQANEAQYFSYLTADAIFFGTDAGERWTREAFRKYAKPFFDKGKAWNFKATRRSVFISKDGNTAWFDETIDAPHLGPTRGTGVLVRDGTSWKIAQYHLCVPIPNHVFAEVKKIIAETPRKETPPKN